VSNKRLTSSGNVLTSCSGKKRKTKLAGSVFLWWL
jgi:hypothetical protein